MSRRGLKPESFNVESPYKAYEFDVPAYVAMDDGARQAASKAIKDGRAGAQLTPQQERGMRRLLTHVMGGNLIFTQNGPAFGGLTFEIKANGEDANWVPQDNVTVGGVPITMVETRQHTQRLLTVLESYHGTTTVFTWAGVMSVAKFYMNAFALEGYATNRHVGVFIQAFNEKLVMMYRTHRIAFSMDIALDIMDECLSYSTTEFLMADGKPLSSTMNHDAIAHRFQMAFMTKLDSMFVAMARKENISTMSTKANARLDECKESFASTVENMAEYVQARMDDAAFNRGVLEKDMADLVDNIIPSITDLAINTVQTAHQTFNQQSRAMIVDLVDQAVPPAQAAIAAAPAQAAIAAAPAQAAIAAAPAQAAIAAAPAQAAIAAAPVPLKALPPSKSATARKARVEKEAAPPAAQAAPPIAQAVPPVGVAPEGRPRRTDAEKAVSKAARDERARARLEQEQATARQLEDAAAERAARAAELLRNEQELARAAAASRVATQQAINAGMNSFAQGPAEDRRPVVPQLDLGGIDPPAFGMGGDEVRTPYGSMKRGSTTGTEELREEVETAMPPKPKESAAKKAVTAKFTDLLTSNPASRPTPFALRRSTRNHAAAGGEGGAPPAEGAAGGEGGAPGGVHGTDGPPKVTNAWAVEEI